MCVYIYIYVCVCVCVYYKISHTTQAEHRAHRYGAPVVFKVPGAPQSINQRSSQSHTRAEEKPHPSATSGVANPASRSDTGLGG